MLDICEPFNKLLRASVLIHNFTVLIFFKNEEGLPYWGDPQWRASWLSSHSWVSYFQLRKCTWIIKLGWCRHPRVKYAINSYHLCHLLGYLVAVTIELQNPVVRLGQTARLMCKVGGPVNSCLWEINGELHNLQKGAKYQPVGVLEDGECGIQVTWPTFNWEPILQRFSYRQR